MNKFIKTLLLFATCISLTSCGETESSIDLSYEDPIYEDYTPDESKFSFAFGQLIDTVSSKLIEKVIDSAKQTASEIVDKQVDKVKSGVKDWLQENIFDMLGLNIFKEEKSYTTDDIYNKLSEVENTLDIVKQSIENIENEQKRQDYERQFEAFKAYYNNAMNYQVVFNNYIDSLNANPLDESILQNTLDSVEKSIRGSVDITVQTQLFTDTLQLGLNIIGSSQPSSNLTTNSIFNIVRSLVELETPFENKRKLYEDTYISSVITTYLSLYSLVQFDILYNLKLNNIDQLYVASDGQVLGFVYDELSYSYWYENSLTQEIQNQYAIEMDDIAFDFFEFPDANSVPNYSDIKFLLDYYKQHTAIKNSILNLYNQYTRNISDENYINLIGNNYSRKLAVTLGTIHFEDFVLEERFINNYGGTNRARNMTLDYDAFDAITSSNLTSFVNNIKRSGQDLTFYEYLSGIGFKIPRSNNAPSNYQCLLPLDGTNYDHEYDVSSKHIQIVTGSIKLLNLDTKISDFNVSNLLTVYIYHDKTRGGICNEKYEYTTSSYLVGIYDNSSKQMVSKIPGSSMEYKSLNLLTWGGLVGNGKEKTGKVNYTKLSSSY